MITEPGAYDIPIAEYHSQCCDGPSISSTGLRIIRNQSLAHFWAQSDLNPNREPDDKPKSLSFGNAAHSLLLEGKLPEDQYALEPFTGGYSKNSDDWKAGEKRKWREQQIAAGRIVVSTEDVEKITRMAETLGRHPLVRDGLFKGHVEQSLFWKSGDVWLKARPDVIPHDTILADYKTTADASPRAIVRDVQKYGYHLQLAMAADGVKEIIGNEIEQFVLLIQEKEPPFVVTARFVHPEYIEAGRHEYRECLERFRKAYTENYWPGYDDGEVHLPDWLRDQLTTQGILK